mmetsp:Transcript_4503/g.14564  ORF Transcript_4503/g.14564 Transcript_4503/m.14564 type:complete len:370 (-) Transcript_4503:97-1206(-)
MSALLWQSRRTVDSKPLLEARVSGVAPFRAAPSLSNPTEQRKRIMPRWPPSAARTRGVSPAGARTSLNAPTRQSKLATSTWPAHAATRRGVQPSSAKSGSAWSSSALSAAFVSPERAASKSTLPLSTSYGNSARYKQRGSLRDLTKSVSSRKRSVALHCKRCLRTGMEQLSCKRCLTSFMVAEMGKENFPIGQPTPVATCTSMSPSRPAWSSRSKSRSSTLMLLRCGPDLCLCWPSPGPPPEHSLAKPAPPSASCSSSHSRCTMRKRGCAAFRSSGGCLSGCSSSCSARRRARRSAGRQHPNWRSSSCNCRRRPSDHSSSATLQVRGPSSALPSRRRASWGCRIFLPAVMVFGALPVALSASSCPLHLR